MNPLIEQARAAAQVGDKTTAVNLLHTVVTQDPRNDAAWELLADVLDKREHVLDCLQRAVRINPGNQSAQRKLAQLISAGVSSTATLSARSTPPPLVSSPPPSPSAAPIMQPRSSLPAEPSLGARAEAISQPSRTKRCPYCAEEIQAAAIVCKHCGRDLAAPATSPAKASTQATQTQPALAVRPAEVVARRAPNRSSSYIDRNLMVGEHVLYHTHIHWAVYMRPLVAMGFGILLAVYMISSAQTDKLLGPALGLFGLAFGGLFILAGALALISVFLIIRTTEFALTNRRVMGKRGILRRRSIELLLPKVESISVNQPILGRLLNYGTVTVVGTGGTREYFNLIENPLEFRKRVQEQIAHSP